MDSSQLSCIYREMLLRKLHLSDEEVQVVHSYNRIDLKKCARMTADVWNVELEIASTKLVNIVTQILGSA